jgi:sec-independent protein translocase protein TatC
MYFRVGLYAGAILAAPWIFYQLWMFVSAGLYKRERRYVLYALPFSAGLFVTGAVFFLLVVSKPMLAFLLGFNSWLELQSIITFEEHVEFVTNMMLVFGLCFQMPLAVLTLAKVGIVSLAGLNKYRRHAIVVILIVAAIVTVSPSPLDQLVLAIPMWLLYELGVVLTYFLVEKPRRREEAAEAAEAAQER